MNIPGYQEIRANSSAAENTTLPVFIDEMNVGGGGRMVGWCPWPITA
jgi:hypothetical protein